MENGVSCTTSTGRVSISLGYPNTKRQLKVRDHGPSAFTVSRLGFFQDSSEINSLHKILPDLCSAVEIKKTTAHYLGLTCASRLFQSEVDKKLIREHYRTCF